MSTAGGLYVTNSYLVNIRLPHGVEFKNMPVLRTDLVGGVDVLIGMDIIAGGDFAITQSQGKTVFSFRYPSIAEIDFVKETNEANARRSGKVRPTTPGGSFHGKKRRKR